MEEEEMEEEEMEEEEMTKVHDSKRRGQHITQSPSVPQV